MSTLSLRLPKSLHRRLSELAERDDVSINQLITSAVAEKMSALLTEEYIHARGGRGSRAKFDRVLRKVSEKEPEPYDRLPAQAIASSRPVRNGGRRRASKGVRRSK